MFPVVTKYHHFEHEKTRNFFEEFQSNGLKYKGEWQWSLSIKLHYNTINISWFFVSFKIKVITMVFHKCLEWKKSWMLWIQITWSFVVCFINLIGHPNNAKLECVTCWLPDFIGFWMNSLDLTKQGQWIHWSIEQWPMNCTHIL
jgi:hypothetical protein